MGCFRSSVFLEHTFERLAPLALDDPAPARPFVVALAVLNDLSLRTDSVIEPLEKNLRIRYRVESDVLNSAYPIRIDFYQVASDGEEPLAWLGGDVYDAPNAGSDVDVTFTPNIAVPGGFELLAIATDADENSSETSNLVFLPEPGTAGGLAGLGLLSILARRRQARR